MESRAGYFFVAQMSEPPTLRIKWTAAQLAQSQEEARRLVKGPRLVF